MTFKTPTAAEVAKIMDRTGLSSKEFGEAIGYSDAERIARALVKGERHGKPYAMSSTATCALRFMLSLHKLTKAHRDYQNDMNPSTEARLADALDEATDILPKRLQHD
jgi:hypothetical protein